MKDPSGLIRTWVFGKLNGTVTYLAVAVPVYSFAPKDQTMPYMLIGDHISSSEMEESTKDKWIARYSFSIEVYFVNTGNDASYVPVNTISDSVMQIIRTRTAIAIAGYTVIGIIFEGSMTDKIDMDNRIVTLKIMNFTLTMEET